MLSPIVCPVNSISVDTSRGDVWDWKLEGGHLALDFVNTVGGLRDEPPSTDDELLVTYENLVSWCKRLGVISEADARRMLRAAARDERGARRALRRALELRELLYPIFRAIADGAEPPAELLHALRRAERDALAHAELVRGGRGGGGSRAGALRGAMRWTWPPPRELADPLRPIAHAAVELLTGGPLEHVKICGNCRWLFLDQSRNHSRRWCSMDECGTQMKQRRFVERRRSARSAAR
jgi:predicted RNA-binding Zn ribbon-like protein